ncbi:four helix bundle protein [Nemorincola caseinilytica]|uniref:Four helix bundle protein n=1 Tax=Nemorincola caseinilytica TaxID=2054315 RepID=A0ABP8N8H9_9BACT
MKQDVVKEKSFSFAVKVVNLYKFLAAEQKEYVISRQLLRSGTSIGANVREARNAESKPDFIHKLAIAQKECDETLYWLDLLKETNYIDISTHNSFSSDANELLRILKSIILSTKKGL